MEVLSSHAVDVRSGVSGDVASTAVARCAYTAVKQVEVRSRDAPGVRSCVSGDVPPSAVAGFSYTVHAVEEEVGAVCVKNVVASFTNMS